MLKFAKPEIGIRETRAVCDALSRDRLTEGPIAAEFEQKFGERFGGHAVAVSSCTAALHLSALTLPKQTLRLPAMTHAATALACEAAGHVVEFVDCNEAGIAHGCDVSVDFLGMEAPKGKIEDAATALHLKTYGDIACFSFYPAKQMTTGEGGMILCRDEKLAEELRRMRAFGKVMEPKFDVKAFGLNYRMSELNAALGCVQLKRLDEFISKREENEKVLREMLHDQFELIGNNYAISAILPENIDRDAIRQKLSDNLVETSVYYPCPVPKLTYFKDPKAYPNAQRISSNSITLSVGPHLTPSDMQVQAALLRELCWLAVQDS